MRLRRGTLSVSARLYDRLHAHCKAAGVTMSSLVERLVEPVLESGQPPLKLRQVTVKPPSASRLSRDALDRIAADRKNLGLLRAAPPIARSPVALDIPAHVSSALHDLREREEAAGREASLGELLEAAINRMLDAMDGAPWWCRTCLENLGGCRCPVRSSVPR